MTFTINLNLITILKFYLIGGIACVITMNICFMILNRANFTRVLKERLNKNWVKALFRGFILSWLGVVYVLYKFVEEYTFTHKDNFKCYAVYFLLKYKFYNKKNILEDYFDNRYKYKYTYKYIKVEDGYREYVDKYYNFRKRFIRRYSQ